MLVHPALGLGPLCIDLKRKIRYPTMARLALEERLRRENLAEEQRILYVAMTRPKEKLILVDALYGAEKRLQKLAAAAACPVMPEAVAEADVLRRLDLAAAAVPAGGRAFAGIWPGWMAGGLYTGDTAPWQVFVHDGDDFGCGAAERPCPTRRKMQEERSLTRRCWTFRYPYQRETTAPGQAHRHAAQGPGAGSGDRGSMPTTRPDIRPLAQPKFRRENQGLTPAERGTATHLVLAVSGSAKSGCARTGGKAAAGGHS